MKKAYYRLLWHLKELNKMFSNEPSYYSLKRVIEIVLITNAIILFDTYVFKYFGKISFPEMCEAFILNMGYAGYMRAAVQKEKRLENQENKTDENK